MHYYAFFCHGILNFMQSCLKCLNEIFYYHVLLADCLLWNNLFFWTEPVINTRESHEDDILVSHEEPHENEDDAPVRRKKGSKRRSKTIENDHEAQLEDDDDITPVKRKKASKGKSEVKKHKSKKTKKAKGEVHIDEWWMNCGKVYISKTRSGSIFLFSRVSTPVCGQQERANPIFLNNERGCSELFD